MNRDEHSSKPILSQSDRVQALTAREWIYEYDQTGKVWRSALGIPPAGSSYITVPDDFNPKFKTTKPGKATVPRIRVQL